MIENNMAKQGWQCPICKRVYAPFVTMCSYCSPSNKNNVPSVPPTYEFAKDVPVLTTRPKMCGHCPETDGLIYTGNPPKVRCAKTGRYKQQDDFCDCQTFTTIASDDAECINKV